MPRALLAPLILLLAALLLAGCEFFPKTGTEWGIAGAIFGVIIIAVVYFAWKGSRGPPK